MHKEKEGMIDNRRVKDSHQEGISRVKQRMPEKEHDKGHQGKMGKNMGSEKNWKRSSEPLTPRRA